MPSKQSEEDQEDQRTIIEQLMNQVSQKVSENVQIKGQIEQLQSELRKLKAENADLKDEKEDLLEKIRQLKTVNTLVSQ